MSKWLCGRRVSCDSIEPMGNLYRKCSSVFDKKLPTRRSQDEWIHLFARTSVNRKVLAVGFFGHFWKENEKLKNINCAAGLNGSIWIRQWDNCSVYWSVDGSITWLIRAEYSIAGRRLSEIPLKITAGIVIACRLTGSPLGQRKIATQKNCVGCKIVLIQVMTRGDSLACVSVKQKTFASVPCGNGPATIEKKDKKSQITGLAYRWMTNDDDDDDVEPTNITHRFRIPLRLSRMVNHPKVQIFRCGDPR